MYADKDYFLDENKQLAKSEKDAAFLLIRKGQALSPAIAEQYGIKGVKAPGEKEAPAAKSEPAATETKRAAAPAENKSAKK